MKKYSIDIIDLELSIKKFLEFIESYANKEINTHKLIKGAQLFTNIMKLLLSYKPKFEKGKKRISKKKQLELDEAQIEEEKIRQRLASRIEALGIKFTKKLSLFSKQNYG
jgi:hypothetical protein